LETCPLAFREKTGAQVLIRELQAASVVADMIYQVYLGRLPIDCPSAHRV
jgi:hypothetical protein